MEEDSDSDDDLWKKNPFFYFDIIINSQLAVQSAARDPSPQTLCWYYLPNSWMFDKQLIFFIYNILLSLRYNFILLIKKYKNIKHDNIYYLVLLLYWLTSYN